MIGLTILHDPDGKNPLFSETSGWPMIPCGVWFIGNVKHRVDIFHPPGKPPADVDALLDETFAEHRRHGQKVVKATEDQSHD